jgi:hypothetical protein
MGTGKDSWERRVVYEHSFKWSQHDNRAINKLIERAEAVAADTRPLKTNRFVKITDAVKSVDWDLFGRARYLAGLKGYVTNIDADTMDGQQVVAAYRDLYQVERSFRMAKSDLAARHVPPHPRQHQSPLDRRVRRARGLPRSPSTDRRQHQEDHPDTTIDANSHDQARQPADHRPTAHPRPRPSPPRRTRRGWY